MEVRKITENFRSTINSSEMPIMRHVMVTYILKRSEKRCL